MQKKWRASDDFGLRSPVIQKTFQPKKWYTLIPFQPEKGIHNYLYRSTRHPLHCFSQKKVYHTISAKKWYTLIPLW